MTMLKFQNISKGIPISHGREDDPDSGGVYVNPNGAGILIHSVAPGQIGEMPDGPGARHFEKLGLIRPLSRDASPTRNPVEEENVALRETNARLIGEIANRERELTTLRGFSAGAPPVEAKKQPAKSS
jgi:hypothetical protein